MGRNEGNPVAAVRQGDWEGWGGLSYRSDLWGSALAFLIPALVFVEVDVGGRLFLSEILLAVLLPWLLAMRGGQLSRGLPRRILVLGLLWLLALVVTDEIRGTPFADWSRGWAKTAFLLLEFAAVYLLLDGKKQRYFMFAAGIAVGKILGYYFAPNVFAFDYPWKFGYGAALTLLAVLAASRYFLAPGGRGFSAAVMLAMGVVNFYMGFRSLGLVCLLGGLLILARRSPRSAKDNPVKTAALVGAAIVGIMAFYDYGASQNYFGEAEQSKYLWQSAGSMGVLIGARSEILVSAQAVMDSPLIGHGSWAKDPRYAQMMADELAQMGYVVPGVLDSDLIPSHSYLMGAWVEAGVFGAVFWAFGLLLTFRALSGSRRLYSYLAPLVVFEALNFLWAIPFSPFGAEARLYAAYDFALMVFALSLVGPSTAKADAA